MVLALVGPNLKRAAYNGDFCALNPQLQVCEFLESQFIKEFQQLLQAKQLTDHLCS